MSGVDFHLSDWLAFLLRWIHLIAGISWIGNSFYFMWLDAHLTLPDPKDPTNDPTNSREDVEGELWMVHSGGFYRVERKRIAPGRMPKTLHWFKFEALFTWMSGICLLSLIYYLNPDSYLVDRSVSSVSSGLAVLMSLTVLGGGWVLYDTFWQSGWAKKHADGATILSILGAALAALGFCSFLSGRAAFIHMGALFGTLMVANVWFRILPVQQQMIDATDRGVRPDYQLSQAAKRRSVHNSYMTFPVLFMMLSNHYPMVYGHGRPALMLISLVVLGALIRHGMLVRSQNSIKTSVQTNVKTGAKESTQKWAILGISALAFAWVLPSFTSLLKGPSALPVQDPAQDAPSQVAFHEVQSIINLRCLRCHATDPEDKINGPAASVVRLETPEQIKTFAARIKVRAVETKTMPLANKTEMTHEERVILGRWIDQGAKLPSDS